MVSQIGTHAEISMLVASTNVEMMWNIIIQNSAFQGSAGADDTRAKLRQHYITHLKQYVENCIQTKTLSTLIDLNKSFIVEFIHGFRETEPATQKLDLTSTVPVKNDVITIEEIKAERLNKFDSQYDKMKTDFDQYRTTDAVGDAKFTDNTVVEPLKGQDMEDMLSRTLQNRTEQENASVPRNVVETQRARDWLNLDAGAGTDEVVMPHPERKAVSFVSEPDIDIPTFTLPPLQLSQQVSPMVALQTRMAAMETKMEEIHALIVGMTVVVKPGTSIEDAEQLPDQKDAP